MKISDMTIEALQILEKGPLTPGEFADQMWPDSPAHQVSYTSGRIRGRGIVKSAGSSILRICAKPD